MKLKLLFCSHFLKYLTDQVFELPTELEKMIIAQPNLLAQLTRKLIK